MWREGIQKLWLEETPEQIRAMIDTILECFCPVCERDVSQEFKSAK